MRGYSDTYTDSMVDKYFDFVYGIEDKVYNFEARHVDDRYSKNVMENVFSYVQI